MLLRKIVIVVKANTEDDISLAVHAVANALEDGYVSGSARNGETSGYYFTTTDDVPDDEVPT